MGITVECENCYWSASAPEKFAGRRIKCRNCGEAITVEHSSNEDYEEYRRPVRKTRQKRRPVKRSKGFPTVPLIIGGGCFALVFVIGGLIHWIGNLDFNGSTGISAMSGGDGDVDVLAPNQSELKESILKSSELMQAALTNGDLDTFADYTHPDVISMIGGKARMKAMMAPTLSETVSSIEKSTIGTISDVVVDGRQLAAFVLVETVYRFSDGGVVRTSYRVACSTDEGASWTFMDSQGKRAQEDFIKERCPVLTSRIPFPDCTQRPAQ